jgi:YfiH family protein
MLLERGPTLGPHVGACMTLRRGGLSRAPWDSLNLGARCGDDEHDVRHNRHLFAKEIGAAPVWLNQVHGNRVVAVTAADVDGEPITADAAWTDRPGVACTVLVADCLPVLLAAPTAVAAAHAGWRALAAGVLERAVQALCAGSRCGPAQLRAWLGPCIGPRRFEVGADVLEAFGAEPRPDGATHFVAQGVRDGQARWLADLSGLARERLLAVGLRDISLEQRCTVENPSTFFSYRRDGVTGRMAAAIWLRA